MARLTDRSDEQSHHLFQGKRPLICQERQYSNLIPGRPATFVSVSARATATAGSAPTCSTQASDSTETCPQLERDRDDVFAVQLATCIYHCSSSIPLLTIALNQTRCLAGLFSEYVRELHIFGCPVCTSMGDGYQVTSV